MKIFISWSGTLSKELAESIRKWLPSVLQAAKPYFSPDDITKGSRWSGEIAKNLEESKVGIFCVTPDNAGADWMLFEAGAISRSIEKGKVIPILFGLDASDLTGPYTQFQAAPYSKDEVFKLLKTVNSTLDSQALSDEVLRDVYDMWWPKLDEKIQSIMKRFEESGDLQGAKRPDREMLEEVLLLTRRLSSGSSRSRTRTIPEGLYRELVLICTALVDAPLGLDFSCAEIERLVQATQFLIRRSSMSDESREEFSSMLSPILEQIEEHKNTTEDGSSDNEDES